MTVARPTVADRFGGYARVSIILHWFSAAALLFLFLLHDDPVVAVHIGFGFVLGPVLVARIMWRLSRGFPRVADQGRTLNVASRLIKLCLLASVLVLVVTGFLLIPFSAEPLRVFFLPPLEIPLQPRPRAAQIVGTIHAWTAYILVILVALHIADGLKSFLIDESSILRRMLRPVEKGF